MNGMEQGKALFDKFREGCKKCLSEKRGSFLLCVGIGGMVLILLSTVIGTDTGRSNAQKTQSGAGEFAAVMEERLTAIIRNIDGVGRCQVMVTTESGVENVYAVEETRSVNASNSYDKDILQKQTQQENSAQKYIVVDTGGGKKEALLKTERPPKIQGVVVICEGAASTIVQQRVTEVVATALDIPYTKVCVTKIGK